MVAVNPNYISAAALMWRNAALVAQIAGYVATGLSIGMAPYSVELTRWALGVFVRADG